MRSRCGVGPRCLFRPPQGGIGRRSAQRRASLESDPTIGSGVRVYLRTLSSAYDSELVDVASPIRYIAQGFAFKMGESPPHPKDLHRISFDSTLQYAST